MNIHLRGYSRRSLGSKSPGGVHGPQYGVWNLGQSAPKPEAICRQCLQTLRKHVMANPRGHGPQTSDELILQKKQISRQISRLLGLWWWKKAFSFNEASPFWPRPVPYTLLGGACPQTTVIGSHTTLTMCPPHTSVGLDAPHCMLSVNLEFSEFFSTSATQRRMTAAGSNVLPTFWSNAIVVLVFLNRPSDRLRRLCSKHVSTAPNKTLQLYHGREFSYWETRGDSKGRQKGPAPSFELVPSLAPIWASHIEIKSIILLLYCEMNTHSKLYI